MPAAGLTLASAVGPPGQPGLLHPLAKGPPLCTPRYRVHLDAVCLHLLESMMTHFSLDSLRIAETRARQIDTDFGTACLQVGNPPVISMTGAMGLGRRPSGPAGSLIADVVDTWKVAV